MRAARLLCAIFLLQISVSRLRRLGSGGKAAEAVLPEQHHTPITVGTVTAKTERNRATLAYFILYRCMTCAPFSFVNHCGGHDCECGPQPPRLREQW